jgi:L-ascorbate metabolism protein UlaG (beta-lactamase superfamily)
MSSPKRYWHGAHGFSNPEGTKKFRIGPGKILKYLLTRMWYPPTVLGKDVPADFVLSESQAMSCIATAENPSATWLGHCAFLFQIGGKRILTDPFLDGSAGPFFLRTLRRLPPSISPEHLPQVDILLISHMHQDHLHAPSIRRLKNRKNILGIVPLGVGPLLKKCGIENVIELDWFGESTQGSLTITFLPAIHYSDPFRNGSLWGGFAIYDKVSGKKVFFSGDTGYGHMFSRDIRPYGPFNLACIGVGAYLRNTYGSNTHDVHATPEEAIQIAMDINAAKAVGMHWATVHMADDNDKETAERFFAAAKKVSFAGAKLPRIGETISF